MEDPAHGDRPQPSTAEVEMSVTAEAPAREAIADAIPTVAPSGPIAPPEEPTEPEPPIPVQVDRMTVEPQQPPASPDDAVGAHAPEIWATPEADQAQALFHQAVDVPDADLAPEPTGGVQAERLGLERVADGLSAIADQAIGLPPGRDETRAEVVGGPSELEAVVPSPPPGLEVAPAQIREDQIWSGPDAEIPLECRPDPEPEAATAAAPPSALAIASAAAAVAPASVVAREVPAFTPAPTPAAAPSAAARLAQHAPAWPSVSLPSGASAAGAWHYVRLAIKGAAITAFVSVVALLVLVLSYRWVNPPTSTLMLGQRLTGTAIEQIWVPIDRISPNLVQAVLLSEDGGFCRHSGVDWSALEEAIESDRGGSTITMQVVKNLFLWPARSYVRKALEIMLAYLVEFVWPKERILEIYLNIAEWGPGVFGAEAAARNHFGKGASQLTAQEAALLAVALPSPIERQPGSPGYQHRRLASNLLTRMRSVRTPPRCVRVRRADS